MVWSSIKACVVVQIQSMNIVQWLIFMLLCKHVVSWASWHLWSSGCKGAQHMLMGSPYSQIVLVGLGESALNLLWIVTCCSLPSGMYDSECVIVLVPCVSVKGLCLSISGQLCRDGRGRACLLQIPHTSMTQLHVRVCGWGLGATTVMCYVRWITCILMPPPLPPSVSYEHTSEGSQFVDSHWSVLLPTLLVLCCVSVSALTCIHSHLEMLCHVPNVVY